MPTDTTHIHLLLDRIREQQHHHGAVLLDIAERQEEGLKLLKVDQPRRHVRDEAVAAALCAATIDQY